jgi:hypothetical protein
MTSSARRQKLSLADLIAALEPVGWHVIEIRPSFIDDRPALWRVTIERYDESASMTVIDADPDDALADLARYAQADAKGTNALAV